VADVQPAGAEIDLSCASKDDNRKQTSEQHTLAQLVNRAVMCFSPTRQELAS